MPPSKDGSPAVAYMQKIKARLDGIGVEVSVLKAAIEEQGRQRGRMLELLSEIATPKPAAVQPGLASDKLIMIVDDDDSIRDLMTTAISRDGFRVESAFDGEDAVHKINELHPDLIVLDLMMPRFGGFEILRRLQGGSQAKTPVMVVSGRYTEPSTVDMIRREANVIEFLTKPIRPMILVGKIHAALGTRSLR